MNFLNSINNNKAGFNKPIKYRLNNSVSFKGHLEDSYFKSAKTNDIKGQLSALKNLGFDISEIDYETQSNFLHFAIKSQNNSVINQALLLLSKNKSTPQTIAKIIEQKDLDGKTPCEYAKNETTIKIIEKIAGSKIQTENAQSGYTAIKENDNYPEKLNILPEGTSINIPVSDEDDGIEFINQPSTQALKTSKAKDILLNRIVKPLTDDEFIADDGAFGSFNVQTETPRPNGELRLSLINQELDKMSQYTKDISLEHRKYLSERLGGFSSKDITDMLENAIGKHCKYPNSPMTIEEFINEANEFAKNRNLPEINDINKTSGYDTIIKRRNIKYPANFDDVAGMEDVKREFKAFFIDGLNPEVMERLRKDGNNSPLKSTFLLYGPTGTGKTFIAEALAGETKLPMYEIDPIDVCERPISKAEKNITNIFNQLEEKFKETGEYSILFVDDLGGLIWEWDDENNDEARLSDLFSQKIHNCAQRGIITVIATNYRNRIDKAVLKNLERQIEILPPDEKAKKALVTSQFSKRPSARNITDSEIDEIVKMLSGFSSRDITYVLQEIIDNNLVYNTAPLEFNDFKAGIKKYAMQHKINIL